MADDTHPGLDLPLLTFSCIVGIKLSQATYYLRSQDLVAALLAQLADCAACAGTFVALLSSRGADARPAPRCPHAVAPSASRRRRRRGAGRTPESQGRDDEAHGGGFTKTSTRCSSRSGGARDSRCEVRIARRRLRECAIGPNPILCSPCLWRGATPSL